MIDSACAVQDVFNCMCLSEGVYKVVDYGEAKAAEILAAIIEGFPPGLVSLKRVQWSQPYAQHRHACPFIYSCRNLQVFSSVLPVILGFQTWDHFSDV